MNTGFVNECGNVYISVQHDAMRWQATQLLSSKSCSSLDTKIIFSWVNLFGRIQY